MAEDLDVSPAMLSGVENGKKSIPLDWESKLIELYHLDDKQKDELHQIIIEGIKQIRLDTTNVCNDTTSLAISFARNFEKMDEAKRNAIRALLEEVDGDDTDGNKKST
jgi:tRNA uridine 5-carbamoylmethylation protein Kti12